MLQVRCFYKLHTRLSIALHWKRGNSISSSWRTLIDAYVKGNAASMALFRVHKDKEISLLNDNDIQTISNYPGGMRILLKFAAQAQTDTSCSVTDDVKEIVRVGNSVRKWLHKNLAKHDGTVVNFLKPISAKLDQNDIDTAIRTEKLIVQSAKQVHPMLSMKEKEHRLFGHGHYCITLSHKDVGILCAVECFLSNSVPNSIVPLLFPQRNSDHSKVLFPNVTTFYSIVSTNHDARSFGLGAALLKHAKPLLLRFAPTLSTFQTLSPIPGLRDWCFDAYTKNKATFVEEDVLVRQAFLHLTRAKRGMPPGGLCDAEIVPHAHKFDNNRRYFIVRDVCNSSRPYNAVSRFHLGNGAALERIVYNACFDVLTLTYVPASTPTVGEHDSFGVMCAYRYDGAMQEANAGIFRNGGVVISEEVYDIFKHMQ